MSLLSLRDTVVNTVPDGDMFDEMQREDFLALAAALRQARREAPVAPKQAPVSRLAGEPRLTLAFE